MQVRFDGLDEPVVPDAPDFMKSLDIDHARDGEVIVAFGMNGEQLPYTQRLSRCAWSCRAGIPPTGSKCSAISRYLTNPTTITGRRRPTDSGHAWRERATRRDRLQADPDQPDGAAVVRDQPAPGQHRQGRVRRRSSGALRSAAIQASPWSTFPSTAARPGNPPQLGRDEGKYSFRQWQTEFTPDARGEQTVMVRCTNTSGVVQPSRPIWNPPGFMQNVIESMSVTAI